MAPGQGTLSRLDAVLPAIVTIAASGWWAPSCRSAKGAPAPLNQPHLRAEPGRQIPASAPQQPTDWPEPAGDGQGVTAHWRYFDHVFVGPTR
ncbi:hypothetical protein GCM10017567_70380 [Amycolatopsis bullii]|uniref:Uncharacterized protein n=1 Tax=Amycolatopsis bullii TaxID=941987 RepID=A0ABQ3KS71_9PSEU|nr:hypothetical protein GCM10017567_70380 [Amycolatopsis bullii]